MREDFKLCLWPDTVLSREWLIGLSEIKFQGPPDELRKEMEMNEMHRVMPARRKEEWKKSRMPGCLNSKSIDTENLVKSSPTPLKYFQCRE